MILIPCSVSFDSATSTIEQVQKIYNVAVFSLLRKQQLSCATAGCAGHHFYINRYRIKKIELHGERFPLIVIVVQCQSCGRYHTIILDSFIPYAHWVKPDVAAVLSMEKEIIEEKALLEEQLAEVQHNLDEENQQFGLLELRIQKVEEQIEKGMKVYQFERRLFGKVDECIAAEYLLEPKQELKSLKKERRSRQMSISELTHKAHLTKNKISSLKSDLIHLGNSGKIFYLGRATARSILKRYHRYYEEFVRTLGSLDFMKKHDLMTIIKRCVDSLKFDFMQPKCNPPRIFVGFSWEF